MEDVICPKCNKINSYTHNFCSGCGDKLKGTCATCNREENITFVEAEVCQWHVLEDREDFSKKLEILRKSTSWRYGLGVLLILAIAFLTGSTIAIFQSAELKIIEVVLLTLGGGFLSLIYYISLLIWKCNKECGFRDKVIKKFKESNQVGVKLLEKVGWKILP